VFGEYKVRDSVKIIYKFIPLSLMVSARKLKRKGKDEMRNGLEAEVRRSASR
jgi:hypothetical protein